MDQERAFNIYLLWQLKRLLDLSVSLGKQQVDKFDGPSP